VICGHGDGSWRSEEEKPQRNDRNSQSPKPHRTTNRGSLRGLIDDVCPEGGSLDQGIAREVFYAMRAIETLV
jgi:hypothetical protein